MKLFPSDSLKIDLYEFTMAAGYFLNHMNPQATFELYCHTPPKHRSFLIACGLEQIVDFILHLKFSHDDIAYLKGLPVFRNVPEKFFKHLKRWKFTGDLWAMEEGEVCFAGEPLIQVEAPILEGQILETYLLSMINIQTSVASKAARVVHAACSDGVKRPVIDFGSRRAHGPEAGVLAARAAYIGGCQGTSNVYAGKKFDIPVFGTMAHSWIQAFNREQQGFEKYQEIFPKNTVLLIDTYDTINAAMKLAALGRPVAGVRLDSGNLLTLSRRVRKILDQAGMTGAKIVASGNLNEYKIFNLVKKGCRIDLFGVGTEMVVSRDYPALDLTYKLVQTVTGRDVHYKAKLSHNKRTMPGKKQVIRFQNAKGQWQKDMLALGTEHIPKGGRPLLKKFIEKGVLIKKLPLAARIRDKVQENLAGFPSAFFDLTKDRVVQLRCSRDLLAVQSNFFGSRD